MYACLKIGHMLPYVTQYRAALQFLMKGVWCGGGGVHYSNQYYNHIMLLIHSMDISSEEDERTLTMVDPSYAAEDDSSCVPTAAVARPLCCV